MASEPKPSQDLILMVAFIEAVQRKIFNTEDPVARANTISLAYTYGLYVTGLPDWDRESGRDGHYRSLLVKASHWQDKLPHLQFLLLLGKGAFGLPKTLPIREMSFRPGKEIEKATVMKYEPGDWEKLVRPTYVLAQMFASFPFWLGQTLHTTLAETKGRDRHADRHTDLLAAGYSLAVSLYHHPNLVPALRHPGSGAGWKPDPLFDQHLDILKRMLEEGKPLLASPSAPRQGTADWLLDLTSGLSSALLFQKLSFGVLTALSDHPEVMQTFTPLVSRVAEVADLGLMLPLLHTDTARQVFADTLKSLEISEAHCVSEAQNLLQAYAAKNLIHLEPEAVKALGLRKV